MPPEAVPAVACSWGLPLKFCGLRLWSPRRTFSWRSSRELVKVEFPPSSLLSPVGSAHPVSHVPHHAIPVPVLFHIFWHRCAACSDGFASRTEQNGNTMAAEAISHAGKVRNRGQFSQSASVQLLDLRSFSIANFASFFSAVPREDQPRHQTEPIFTSIT